jgi:hypothetical protein
MGLGGDDCIRVVNACVITRFLANLDGFARSEVIFVLKLNCVGERVYLCLK